MAMVVVVVVVNITLLKMVMLGWCFSDKNVIGNWIVVMVLS